MNSGSTRNQIITLGAANAYNSALQFLLPVLLVRLLDVESFGLYKLFWLVVSTVMIFAPMGMPRSLHYFLPRIGVENRPTYVMQTILFLFLTALIGALLVSPMNVFLPEKFATLNELTFSMPAFIVLWVIASLIEVLPSADQRFHLQAYYIIGFSTLRVSMIILVAWLTADIRAVFISLLLFAAFKLAVLFYYISRYHRLWSASINPATCKDQMRHALPFGITGMINKLRPVAEQWIIAIMFTTAQFGVFSIAVGMMPLLSTLKTSVGFVTVSKMSRLQSEGKIQELMALNNKGNIGVAFIMFPVVAFLFMFADYVVSFLYTESYLEAASVIKVYAVVVMMMSVEVSSVLIVFRQGKFVSLISALLILLAIAASYIGARSIGLAGGAAGSLMSVFIATILYYRRVAIITGIRISGIQQWSVLGKLAAAAFLACFVSSLATEHIPLDKTIYKIAFAVISSGILYISLILLSGEKWLLVAFAGKGGWKLSSHA